MNNKTTKKDISKHPYKEKKQSRKVDYHNSRPNLDINTKSSNDNSKINKLIIKPTTVPRDHGKN